MKRRLFCEISPLTFAISRYKNIFQRKIKDYFSGITFAQDKVDFFLPYLVYQHSSPIKRILGNVDIRLQKNKETNLMLAAPLINGVVIRPGEIFSFWNLVGECTAKKGYKEGLVISDNKISTGVGGGMCQLTNLIHWMVLHSSLEVIEHHHHDNYDLFPDCERKVPFGTGTSIAYNYMDYRLKNTSAFTYQITVCVKNGFLHGELRCDNESEFVYEIEVENENFIKEQNSIFRTGEVFKTVKNKKDGKIVSKECIRTNHARVMYNLDV